MLSSWDFSINQIKIMLPTPNVGRLLPLTSDCISIGTESAHALREEEVSKHNSSSSTTLK
jgi:hypothetical protein